MRNTADRIRHAIGFEIVGLILVTPAGVWLFDVAMWDLGVVAIASSIVATIWNYIYNLLFDTAMQRFAGHTGKSLALRVLHAIGFEIGLILMLMPIIAWYLDIGLIDALLMDASLAVFYLVYAFFYNWTYDLVFPIPPARSESARAEGH